jgi:hypothetical protein
VGVSFKSDNVSGSEGAKVKALGKDRKHEVKAYCGCVWQMQ